MLPGMETSLPGRWLISPVLIYPPLSSDLAHPDHILLVPKGRMQLCRVISSVQRLRSCDTTGGGEVLILPG